MVAVPEQFDGSLEQAYVAHAAMLRRRARRWMPADEVEDAVQETFLRAWKRHGDSDPGIPWLLTVLRNIAIDRSRRHRAEPVGDLELLDSPHEDGPEQKVIALDERRAVRDAIRELTEGQQRALHLREWQGMSHQEIADSLGTTVPSVESLLVRSRRRMRGMLEKVMAVALWPAAGVWRKLRHLPTDAGTTSAATSAGVGTFSATVANLATAAAVLMAGAGGGGMLGGTGADAGATEPAIALAGTSGVGGSGAASGSDETRYLGQQSPVTDPASTSGTSTTTGGTAAAAPEATDDGSKLGAPADPSKQDPNDGGKTSTHPDPVIDPSGTKTAQPGGGGKTDPATDPSATGTALPDTGVEGATLSANT